MSYDLDMGRLAGRDVVRSDAGTPPTADRVVGLLTARDPSLRVEFAELDGQPATALVADTFRLVVTDGNARASLPEPPARAALRAVLEHLRAIHDETGWRIHDPQTGRLLPADVRVSDLLPDEQPEPVDWGPRRTSRAGLFKLLREEGGRRIP